MLDSLFNKVAGLEARALALRAAASKTFLNIFLVTVIVTCMTASKTFYDSKRSQACFNPSMHGGNKKVTHT